MLGPDPHIHKATHSPREVNGRHFLEACVGLPHGCGFLPQGNGPFNDERQDRILVDLTVFDDVLPHCVAFKLTGTLFPQMPEQVGFKVGNSGLLGNGPGSLK